MIAASDDKYEVESKDLDYTLKIKDCMLEDAGEVSLTIGDQHTSAQLVVAGSRLYTARIIDNVCSPYNEWQHSSKPAKVGLDRVKSVSAQRRQQGEEFR